MIQRRATYRVQLRAEHGFDDVAAITDYLDALGVSHLHASPILQAAPGSTHGYDVVAHDRVSRELGGADAHARLLAALRARGLGWILDIVPNHMAIGTRENAWWWDVLENGPTSRYARTFDVEWRRGDDDRIVLPILGARYADALEGKQIAIVRDGTAFEARYGDHRLPLAPQSIGAPLGAVAAAVGGAAGERLAFVADGLAALPLVTEDRDAAARRHRDKEVLTAILRELIDGDAALARAIDADLAAISADPVRLDAMLERQNWRLFHWSAASSDISYRRFFDVASLAGLRTEDPHVALDTHRAILRWLDDGTLDGVRIDHVDGLRDPTAYLQWLRRRAPRAWIVVEKILAAGEALPEAWPIDGTTGYDAMRILDHAFVDPSAERALEDVWLANGGEPTAWSAQSRAARREVIELMFGHERDRLVELACSAARARMELRDVTRRELSAAVTHLLASFPVYRTYVRPGEPPSDADRAHVDRALTDARADVASEDGAPEIDSRVWAFLGGALLRPERADELELAMRMQQTTGAVMAKGVEDTLYYRILRYITINEVGGDGGRFGLAVDQIHQALAAGRPQSIVATATHDTKRGEDVRARLAVISEIPDAWAAAVARWSVRAARFRTGDGLPDLATEYLWWQTWVGAHPPEPDRAWPERAWAYLEKAVREAKRRTSWHRPDQRYEGALRGFVEGTLADVELAADVASFVASIEQPTLRNSLARTLIKLTAPGVPEIYQGTELWDFSLVDPDNRRSVDYAKRRALLARAERASPEDALRGAGEGLAKLWLIQRALRVRREHPVIFDGAYRRVRVGGPRADNVLAYERGGELAVIVPRLTTVPAPGWSETRVALDGEWEDVLTGERAHGVTAAERLWARFPVALLMKRARRS